MNIRLEVFELLKAGNTQAEAARILSVSGGRVSQIYSELVEEGFIKTVTIYTNPYGALESKKEKHRKIRAKETKPRNVTKGYETQEKVLALMLEGKRQKDVCDITGLAKGTVSKAAKHLREEGLLPQKKNKK